MLEDFDKGNVFVKVVFWFGGYIMFMIYKLLGYDWMEGRLENGGYEEFSGIEFKFVGWNEDYKVVKYVYSLFYVVLFRSLFVIFIFCFYEVFGCFFFILVFLSM